MILDMTYMITMCIFKSPYLEQCFGCNNSQIQAWKVHNCRLSILTPAIGRCFALFCYGVCTKKWCMFQPRWPQDLTWKVGKPRYKSPTFSKSLLKKMMIERTILSFLYGIAYMILGAMNLCTVFFLLWRNQYLWWIVAGSFNFMDTSTEFKIPPWYFNPTVACAVKCIQE